MSHHEYRPALALRVVWPLEALILLTTESRHRSAVILSVKSVDEIERRLLVTGLAVKLAKNGVELFALVGEESEQAHDALDWVLEEVGADDVMTTWHDQDDPADVASFVVASSRAGGLTRIVAVLDESTESGKRLRNTIAEALCTDADG